MKGQRFNGPNDAEVCQGFEGIRVRYWIDTDHETVEVLRELMKLSLVYDITRNGINVDVSITRF